MDRLELRAAARAAARSSRMPVNEPRDPSPPPRTSQDAPPPLPASAIDEDVARRACAPMGALASIVVSRAPRKPPRTYYVIDPDPTLRAEYERQGLELVPGCRVLVDAAALKPLAVLSVIEAEAGRESQEDVRPPAGFNPYFDLPGA